MIRKIAITLLFVSLSLLVGAQSLDELISSGNQYIKLKNYEAAVTDFGKALEQNSASADALNGLIRAYTLSKNFRDALRYVQIAVEQYPANPEFLLRWGIILNLDGASDEAIEQFDKGLAMSPDENITLQLLMNRATAEINVSNFAAAIEDYDKAIELSPRNTSVYNCRGLANYRSENYGEAVADFTNALDLNPTLNLPYYNRGLAFLKMEQRQKACADFQKACQLKISDACKRIVLECRKR